MAGDPTGRISHLPDMHRGVSWKQPVRVATTASITIATALNAGDTIDGVTLAAGDRVLVKDQGTASGNGIYVAGASPARAFDMDQDTGDAAAQAEEVLGAFVYVIAGVNNGGKVFYATNTTAPTLGSTSLTFAEWTGSAAAAADAADAWDEAATNGAFAVRALTTASAGSLQRTAVYADGRTIFGYNRGDNGDVCIRAFDHRTAVLGAEVVLKAALGPETHSVPEVLVLADGTILAAYSAHNGAALYLRISTSPNDIYGGFAAEVNLDSQLGGTAYTYPRLIQVADGTIYLFVRPVSGGSGQSWAYSTSTDGGATWSALTTYFSVASRWSYILCIARNGDSRIDFFGMDGSVANDANVDLGHFYLDTDAGTWHKSDGTSAGSLPLDNTDWTEVYDGTTNAAHTAAIAIEPHTGYPIVAFKVFQSDGTTDIRYRWGRWSGSAWSTAEVCTDGEWVSYQPGDVCLDTGRPNVVYASRQVAGVMQMWRYVTLDNATFTGEQLTSGVTDAVFPCSPDNRAPALPVLWAVGSWTDADTYAQGMSGYVAGDVTVGGTPATTVEAETSFGLSSAVGTDTEYARQDHTHGTPANPVTAAALVALGAVGPLLISDDHSTPIVFADLLLTEEGDDFLYADLGA